MFNINYNHLQEEGSSPVIAKCSTKLKISSNTALPPRTHPISLQINEETQNKALSTESGRDRPSNSDNVKYTALRHTSIRELRGDDNELEGTDPEGTDSSILVTIGPEKRKSIPKIFVFICGLLIIFCVLLAFGLIYVFVVLPLYKGKSVHPDPRVQSEDTVKNLDDCLAKTSCGLVQGMKQGTTCVFRGIPFAVPPTGELRWKQPIAKESATGICWKDIYNAANYGSKCMQPNFNDSSRVLGSEDCLYLNVWTPALSTASSLPVMVWFHSGDFVYGSGHMSGMSPNSETAAATNSVFVTFNYRLGVFGFLAVDEFREEAGGAAGNYGFMDQQLALKWIRANIRNFGGNETSITIFGHGSGATSVHAMLLSPGSKGLFHKAWLTSPIAILNKTVGDACRDNKSFLKSSGCSNVQCLRQLPAETVLKLSPWQLQPHWTLEQLFGIPRNSQIRNDLPIFDGHVVQQSSVKIKYDGPVVPVIFGSSYFDLSSLDTLKTVINVTLEEYNEMMTNYVGILSSDAVTQANSFYSNKRRPDYKIPNNIIPTPSLQLLHILGDIRNVCPMKIVTDNFVSLYPGSSPIYMYVADVYPSCKIKNFSNEENTFVGWDVAAFFGTFVELGYEIGQGELNFQNIIREEVMSFVRSGQPDASRWKTAGENVGVIGRDVTVTPVTSEYFSQCDLWRQYGFFKFTWSEVG